MPEAGLHEKTRRGGVLARETRRALLERASRRGEGRLAVRTLEIGWWLA